MKFQYLTLFLIIFLFQCMDVSAMVVMDHTSLNKRDADFLLGQPNTAIIENNSKRGYDTTTLVVKRCGGHENVDCLLDSVMDLLTSILGDGDGNYYNGKVVDVVHTLVKAVRQLLHVLDLNGRHHNYGDGLNGLLGNLLGGNHHFDDDDDFGCGCNGGDALIDHLVHVIQDLLNQLAGCKDGLIPQLVDAVAALLESLEHDGYNNNHDHQHEGGHQGHNNHHHQEDDGDNNQHHSGHQEENDGDHHQDGHQDRNNHHHNGHDGNKHDGDCDVLNLDCLIHTVAGLVNSLLNGNGHQPHSHQDNNQVSDLVTRVVQLIDYLLDALHLDNNLTLTLKGGLTLHLGITDGDDKGDFGCGCDGDDEALISHLIKTLEHILDQLGDCDDDQGLIGRLIKTVNQLLNTLLDSGGEQDDGHAIRHRLDTQRLRKQRIHTNNWHSEGLDLTLIEGTLNTIEELLDRLLGECDESLLGQIKILVDRILEGVKNILVCLRKGLLNDLLHLVRTLVSDVEELLARCNGGDDKLDHILDTLVHTVKSLISGCGFLGLIDLRRLVTHI